MKLRVAIAAILVIALAAPVVATTDWFTDVPADHPRIEAIRYAKEESLMQGFPNGEMRPDDELTERQFVKVAERLYDRYDSWTRADWAQVMYGGMPSLTNAITDGRVEFRGIESAGNSYYNVHLYSHGQTGVIIDICHDDVHRVEVGLGLGTHTIRVYCPTLGVEANVELFVKAYGEDHVIQQTTTTRVAPSTTTITTTTPRTQHDDRPTDWALSTDGDSLYSEWTWPGWDEYKIAIIPGNTGDGCVAIQRQIFDWARNDNSVGYSSSDILWDHQAGRSWHPHNDFYVESIGIRCAEQVMDVQIQARRGNVVSGRFGLNCWRVAMWEWDCQSITNGQVISPPRTAPTTTTAPEPSDLNLVADWTTLSRSGERRVSFSVHDPPDDVHLFEVRYDWCEVSTGACQPRGPYRIGRPLFGYDYTMTSVRFDPALWDVRNITCQAVEGNYNCVLREEGNT